MKSGRLTAKQVIVILLCSDGAMKLSICCLPPLGRATGTEVSFVGVGVVVIPNELNSLSSVAQVNSTNVPALTFLDRGTFDSIIVWASVN